MTEKYNYYNNLLWNGELPSVLFKINNSTNTWGYATYRFNLSKNTVTPISITMSNKFDSPEKVKIATLVHEMIHIADYYFNPQHFVRNGKKVSKRSYDAHGYVYFIPQMNRVNEILKGEGIVVSAKVTKEEQNQSTLNKADQERLNQKIENGVHLLINKLKVPEKWGSYSVAIAHSNSYRKWKNYIENSDWWKEEFVYTDDYLTRSEKWAQKKTTKLGYSTYIVVPIETFIEKSEATFNERIFGKGDDNTDPKPINKDDTPKAQEEPHLVPLFRFKTSQGNVIELKNRTKAEIELYLRGRFPNWSDRIIQNIMNLKSCYPMGEHRVKLTESDIAEITEEVINALTNGEDSSRTPGQRRSKVKQISPDEYEESIE